ncbi:MAG TPA: glycosyltransferase family 2 protein [Waterburya sp.]
MKFSIITPSFCQGRFIERTIQSVLSQGLSLTEYEYVVCDGGSQDETLDILKRYESQIRWISEPDKGQADAVNKGIAMTTGDIIAWINSDDVYYPGAFEAVRAVFESHPDVQVVYGDADHIDESDQVLDAYPTETWKYERLKTTCYLCQPSVFFRRQLIKELGSIDDSLRYCMDYELWLRFGQHYPFYYLHKKLAGSRLYSSNKTLGQRVLFHQEINKMLLQKLGSVPHRWIFAYAYVKITENNILEQYNYWQKLEILIMFTYYSLWGFLYWNKQIPYLQFKKIARIWLEFLLNRLPPISIVENISLNFV